MSRSLVTSESNARFLIVNADDFGLTNGLNCGIIEAHERGIVTSASLMVRHPAAVAAAEYARAHPELSVGLHFEVAEWRYRDRKWEMAYRVVDVTDAKALEAEFERQLNRFEELMARKPTHLDSHQHAHLSEPLRGVVLREAKKLQLPLRNCTRALVHCGSFYGQTDEGEPLAEGISRERLVSLIETLPSGWTELTCHPGYARGLDSVYLLGRETELHVLCSEEARQALDRSKVQLCSFNDFPLALRELA